MELRKDKEFFGHWLGAADRSDFVDDNISLNLVDIFVSLVFNNTEYNFCEMQSGWKFGTKNKM